MSTFMRVGGACLYVAILLIINSCQKDPCDGISCQNGGSCTDGKCTCPAGFTGTFCETRVTGKAVFWTSTSPSCGQISVTIEGSTKTITSSASSAPSCDALGSVTFSLPTGTYSYTAKCGTTTWSGSVAIDGNDCQKEQLVVPNSGGNNGGNNGGNTTNGQAIFWASQNLGTVTVTIGATPQTLSTVSTTQPACGTAGSATFTLAPGSYSYSASSSSGSWNGSITVTASGCTATKLDPPSSGGTNGTAIFWLNQDPKCGPVSVVINGTTQQITQFATNAPACGTAGYANFSLVPGTYSYTATCSGTNWNGTITVTSNQCSPTLLLPASKGRAMFWIQDEIGCGDITVNVNGTSKKITGYYSAGAPSCGATAAATFELAPGSYSYTASCTGLTWDGTVTVTDNGCAIMKLNGPKTGKYIFWMNQNGNCGPVTVNVGGQQKSFNQYFTSGSPDCSDASGAALFSLTTGTYSYTASCTGASWNGSITVTENGCGLMRLDPPAGGPGPGPGGSSSGQVAFWSSTQLNCGPVTVNVGGQQKQFNQYFTSGSPTCGNAGTASFTLTPGSYAFSASCTGKTWNGNVTVTNGGCLLFRLDP